MKFNLNKTVKLLFLHFFLLSVFTYMHNMLQVNECGSLSSIEDGKTIGTCSDISSPIIVYWRYPFIALLLGTLPLKFDS